MVFRKVSTGSCSLFFQFFGNFETKNRYLCKSKIVFTG